MEIKKNESMFICSCCGGIFPLDEVDSYKKYPTWWISPPKFEGFLPSFFYM